MQLHINRRWLLVSSGLILLILSLLFSQQVRATPDVLPPTLTVYPDTAHTTTQFPLIQQPVAPLTFRATVGLHNFEEEVGGFSSNEDNEVDRAGTGQDALKDTGNAVLVPPLVAAFNGIASPTGATVRPPDTVGEVGLQHFVEATNIYFQVFDKETRTSVYGPVPIGTLWTELGQPCATSYGEPNVLYDQFSQRWLVSQFVLHAPYGVCIAVSASNDPLGLWHLYYFNMGSTHIYDYPQFAVWHDGYYMASNRLTPQYFSTSSVLVAFERDAMLNGDPARAVVYPQSLRRFAHFADADGITPPTADTPALAIAIQTTAALVVWRMDADWNSPSSTVVTAPVSIPVSEYNGICPGCVPQPDTTRTLAPWLNKLLRRIAYRRFSTHDAIVLAHPVNTMPSSGGPGRLSFRWYEIRGIADSTYSLHQASTYAPNDSIHRWFTGIAQDQQGNIMVGYSAASATVYPGIRYTGRLATDPLNTLAYPDAVMLEGSGSQTGDSRWGDYASMSVDPVDDCTFWYAGEYMQTTSLYSWSTGIGVVRWQTCGVPPTATPTPTHTVTPLPSATPTPSRTPTAVFGGGRRTPTPYPTLIP